MRTKDDYEMAPPKESRPLVDGTYFTKPMEERE